MKPEHSAESVVPYQEHVYRCPTCDAIKILGLPRKASVPLDLVCGWRGCPDRARIDGSFDPASLIDNDRPISKKVRDHARKLAAELNDGGERSDD